MTSWLEAYSQWFDGGVVHLCESVFAGTMLGQPFRVYGLLAIILVSLVCGSVGSLVIGNRMAFFSDALAHCAFAGVGLGLLLGVLSGSPTDLIGLGVPIIMVVMGIGFGLGIAFVRERTGQASDTVIGVFFAGAIGLGAMFLQAEVAGRAVLPPDEFLFGDLVYVTPKQVLALVLLLVVTALAVSWLYNKQVFASFSQSLALSRRLPVMTLNYVFIVLLAVVVNVCLLTVGALLINGLLIVPAAAAANLSRNMRQLFWISIFLCVTEGVVGLWLNWIIRLPAPGGQTVSPGQGGGTIVLLAVVVYFATMLVGPVGRRLRRKTS